MNAPAKSDVIPKLNSPNTQPTTLTQTQPTKHETKPSTNTVDDIVIEKII